VLPYLLLGTTVDPNTGPKATIFSKCNKTTRNSCSHVDDYSIQLFLCSFNNLEWDYNACQLENHKSFLCILFPHQQENQPWTKPTPVLTISFQPMSWLSNQFTSLFVMARVSISLFFVPLEEARLCYHDVHDCIMNSVAAINHYCADHLDHTFEEPIFQENIHSSIAAFKILREEFGDECIAYDTYNIVMSYSVRHH
jgi:hypothetical protein